MEKCLNKTSKQVLNVRLDRLDLGKQLQKIHLFGILAWKARMIKHSCSFFYFLLRQNRVSQLLSCFTKVEGMNLRYQRNYILPKPNTNFGKYLFRMHGSKLFNLPWTKIKPSPLPWTKIKLHSLTSFPIILFFYMIFVNFLVFRSVRLCLSLILAFMTIKGNIPIRLL